MPSGTQGYEITSGSITESLIDRFRKRKDKTKDEKKSGSGKGGALAPTGMPTGGGGGGAVPASVSVVTPNQKLLVSGQANVLGAGSSAIVPTDNGAITKSDNKLVEVNVRILEEQKKQTKLIAAQTSLLASSQKGGALAKFASQESQLEEIEDLSGTQDYSRAKRPKWLDFLMGLIKGVLAAVKALAPVIMKAAALVAAAVAAGKLAGALANALRTIPVRVTEIPRAALPPAAARAALPPAAAVRPSALPRAAAVSPNAKLLPSTTSGTSLSTQAASGQRALPPGQGTAFNPEIKPQTRVLEPVEVGRGNFKGNDRTFEALRQQAQRGVPEEAENARRILQNKGANVNVKPVTPAIPKGAGAADDIVGAAGDIAKTGKNLD